jgi:transcriptional regulator with XRE-family HTH domain
MFMTDRIEQILKTKKLTATQFSEEIGIQRSSLSHILKGRNKPSLDFMLKIKNRYPEINLNWLLLGVGEMMDEDSIVTNKNIPFPEEKGPEAGFHGGERPRIKQSEESRKPGEDEAFPLFESTYSLAAGEIESLIAIYRDGSFKIFRSRK